MKIGMIACAALAMAGMGAAHAQAACGQIVQLALSNHAQVKAMRGDAVEDVRGQTEYKFKPSVNQFESCRIWSSKERDTISGYMDHHLWCDGEADTPEQATKVIEALWACTQDMFTERHATEAWLDGKYRIIAMEGETPTEGREAGLVDFGETDFSRIQLEKGFATSSDYALHVYWSFVK
jgi:hypothetical protein